jgi:hypothetical protein
MADGRDFDVLSAEKMKSASLLMARRQSAHTALETTTKTCNRYATL